MFSLFSQFSQIDIFSELDWVGTLSSPNLLHSYQTDYALTNPSSFYQLSITIMQSMQLKPGTPYGFPSSHKQAKCCGPKTSNMSEDKTPRTWLHMRFDHGHHRFQGKNTSCFYIRSAQIQFGGPIAWTQHRMIGRWKTHLFFTGYYG